MRKPSYNETDVTFVNCKEIPFQRWYPYVEGYSPAFVRSLIYEYAQNAHVIYEPFAGTGTTIFAADTENISTYYSEVNPLLRFLIQTKINVLNKTSEERTNIANQLRNICTHISEDVSLNSKSKELISSYENTFGKVQYFPEETFDFILKLRTYLDNLSKQNKLLSDLATIAAFACLLPSSFLIKRGDVKFRNEEEKKHIKSFETIYPEKILDIAEDIQWATSELNQHHALATPNAKDISNANIQEGIDAVITSPPYLNGTNYFRNTKLELWFMKELKTSSDLRYFRDEALTSGINDVKAEYKNYQINGDSPLLNETLEKLNENAYDKRIPLMVVSYFCEMYQLFSGLSKKLNDNAIVLIDIGDSIFSGVHIKTDLILAEVIKNLGYSLIERKVLRKRKSRNGTLISQILLVIKYTHE